MGDQEEDKQLGTLDVEGVDNHNLAGVELGILEVEEVDNHNLVGVEQVDIQR